MAQVAKHCAGRGTPLWKCNVIDMERELEVEVGVPVPRPVEGDGRVLAGTLPAGSYATLVHAGHPSALLDATAGLLAWGEARRLRWGVIDTDGQRWGARLEIYRSDPETVADMERWETELAIRLA